MYEHLPLYLIAFLIIFFANISFNYYVNTHTKRFNAFLIIIYEKFKELVKNNSHELINYSFKQLEPQIIVMTKNSNNIIKILSNIKLMYAALLILLMIAQWELSVVALCSILLFFNLLLLGSQYFNQRFLQKSLTDAYVSMVSIISLEESAKLLLALQENQDTQDSE